MQPGPLRQLRAGTGGAWGSWCGPAGQPRLQAPPALSRGVSPARGLPPSSTTAPGFSPSLGTPGSSCQARGHSSGQGGARLGLGPRSRPGTGRAACVTHYPGPRWPHPCSSANQPPAPHRGPKAGGGWEGCRETRRPAPSSEPAGPGGARRGAGAARAGRAAPPRPPGRSPPRPRRPAGRPARVSGGESVRSRGRAQGLRGGRGGRGPLSPSHQPSRRGAPCPARPGPAQRRPPPARPGIPCGGMWLLAGPGGTQLAGGREGGARGAGGSGRPGGAAAGGPPGGGGVQPPAGRGAGRRAGVWGGRERWGRGGGRPGPEWAGVGNGWRRARAVPRAPFLRLQRTRCGCGAA